MNATSEVSIFGQFEQFPHIFEKIIKFILILPKHMQVRLVNKQLYYRINDFLNLTIKCSPKWDSTKYIYKFKHVEKEIDITDFCDNRSRDLWPLIKTVSIRRIHGKSDLINILKTLNGKTSLDCHLDIKILDPIPELLPNELILSNNNNNTDSLRIHFPNFWVTKISIESNVAIEFIRFLVYDQFRLIDLSFGREELDELSEILNGDMFNSFNESLSILNVNPVREISITDQDSLMNLLVQKFPNLREYEYRLSYVNCPKITLLSGWKYLTKLDIGIWKHNDNNTTEQLDCTPLHGKLINLKELDLYVSCQSGGVEHANQLIYSLSQLDMPSLARCDIQLKNIVLDLDCLMQLQYGYGRILRSITNFEFTIPKLSNNNQIMYRDVLKKVIKQCIKLNEFHCYGIGQLIHLTNYKLLRSLPESITKIEWRELESNFYSIIFNTSFDDNEQSIISINREQILRLILAMNDMESKRFVLSLQTHSYHPTNENLLKSREELNRIFYVISHEELKIELSSYVFEVEWLLANGRKRKFGISF